MKLHRECVIELIETVFGYIKIHCILAAMIGEELVCIMQATNVANPRQQVRYSGNEETNHQWILTKKDI